MVGWAFRCLPQSHLPSSLIRGGERLREMLSQQGVATLFQPIVNLESSEVIGYEALGRGNHSDLSSNPVELFRLAERCHVAGELSRIFRLAALEQVELLPNGVHVFFNLHPAIVGNPTVNNRFVNRLIRVVQFDVFPNHPAKLWRFGHDRSLYDSGRQGRQL